jgi:hypothetical protein
MQPSQTKRLAQVVHRWLSFQRLCGRSMVFSESYLSQPIAEFLSAHHTGRIAPERNHPIFANLSSGRPKQVDFALLTRDTGAVECVIEAKWARDTAYPKQPILDDLLRLECFRDPTRHVLRYFLMCGLKTHMDNNFLSLRYRDSGTNKSFITELLDLQSKSATKIVEVFLTTGALRKFYSKFESEFRVEVPRRFKTTLLDVRNSDGIAVYLWQVESTKNRRTFSPATEW